MKKLSLLKGAALAVVVLSLMACSKKPATSASETVLAPDASTAGAGYDEGFGENAAGNVHTICHPSVGSDHYYFDFDQDVIHEDDMAALKKQINNLVEHSNIKVRVEGNTDERGSKEYNVALGYRRAKAVARTLSQGGIPFNRVKIVSYGEEKPISSGHDESSWQCNRRVDLVYEDN